MFYGMRLRSKNLKSNGNEPKETFTMHLTLMFLFFLDAVPPAAKVLADAVIVYGLIEIVKRSPLIGPRITGWVAVALNIVLNALGALVTIPADQLYTGNSLLLILTASLGSSGIHGTVNKLNAQAKMKAALKSNQRLAAWALIMLLLMPGFQGCTASRLTR